jgi:glycosyltransferase involved in cell wall biosynthesis
VYLPTSNFASVVIPSFNQGRYLAESVGSVLTQTHPHYEIIIVDDGSADDTALVARELIKLHPSKKISLIQKPNGGAADARNAGIAAAQGSWILTLDGDDKIAPTFLERAFYLAQSIPGTNFVYANLQEFGGGSDSWIAPEYSLSSIMVQNTFPCCSLFKRELWVRAGGYPREFPWGAEDYAFWITIAKLGLRPQRIEESLFHYRINHTQGAFASLKPHWVYFEAMMHTMHGDIYPSKMLAVDHEQVGTMSDEYFEGLKKKLVRFPDLAFPYFWMGLKCEAQSKYEEALEYYGKFVKAHFRPDWQVVWRELLCRVFIGDLKRARNCFEELRTHYPELIWMRETAEKLFSQELTH